MRIKHLLGMAAALSLFSLSAQAANISWAQGPTFGGANGHLGILTNGILVQAVNLTGSAGASVVVDPSGLNISFSTVDSPFFPNSFDDPCDYLILYTVATSGNLVHLLSIRHHRELSFQFASLWAGSSENPDR
jgi:hypothetical protein